MIHSITIKNQVENKMKDFDKHPEEKLAAEMIKHELAIAKIENSEYIELKDPLSDKLAIYSQARLTGFDKPVNKRQGANLYSPKDWSIAKHRYTEKIKSRQLPSGYSTGISLKVIEKKIEDVIEEYEYLQNQSILAKKVRKL